MRSPRQRSRSVAAGLSRIGAAKDWKTKTIAPPDTLTNTAPQIQRLKVACRRGSTGASAETLPSAESNRARAVSIVDDRAEVVRANSIPSRAETGKLAAKQAMASD